MEKRPDLTNIYNRLAHIYDTKRDQFDSSDVFNDVYGFITEKPGKLLDLGCGTGDGFSKYFVSEGWDVVGVDKSPAMLDLADKYVPNMCKVRSDICQVEFMPQSFNFISAVYSLFHLTLSEQSCLYERVYEWLKDDGLFFFTYATKEYTGLPVFEGFVNFFGEQLFYAHKTPEELFTELENLGFTIIDKKNRTIGGETMLWVCAKK